jgi:hypothetical protein
MRKSVSAGVAVALLVSACVTAGTPVPCPDTTPPTLTAFQYTTDGGVTWANAEGVALLDFLTSTILGLRVTGTDDTGLAGATFYINGTPRSASEIEGAYYLINFYANVEAAGSYTVNALVLDGCSNPSALSGDLTFTVDVPASELPVVSDVTIDPAPADPVTTLEAFELSVLVTSGPGHEITAVVFRDGRGGSLNGTREGATDEWTATWQLTDASDGAYSWTARATDEFLNRGESATPTLVNVDLIGVAWRQVGGAVNPERDFQLDPLLGLERVAIVHWSGQPAVIYTSANDPRQLQVKRWNGSAWTALGGQADGLLGALATDGTNLFRARLVGEVSPAVADGYLIRVEHWDDPDWVQVGSLPALVDTDAKANSVALLPPPTADSLAGMMAVAVASTGVEAARFDGAVWLIAGPAATLAEFGLRLPSDDLGLANRLKLLRLPSGPVAGEVVTGDATDPRPGLVRRRSGDTTWLDVGGTVDGALEATRSVLFGQGEDLLLGHLVGGELRWRFFDGSWGEVPEAMAGTYPPDLNGVSSAFDAILVGANDHPVVTWNEAGALRARIPDGTGGWMNAGTGTVISAGARLEPALTTDGERAFVAIFVEDAGGVLRLQVFKF